MCGTAATAAAVVVMAGMLANCRGDAAAATGEQVCPLDTCDPFRTRRAHHWPQARGHVGSYGRTNLTAPANLSSPWYRWFPLRTRFSTVTLCGPLIDDQMNLYVTGHQAIYKLSTDGQLLWERRATSSFVDCPSLMNGVLLATETSGHLFAVELELGQVMWSRKHGGVISGDTGYVMVHDGVVVYESEKENSLVVAANATTGELLWKFGPDTKVWNLMAMFPEDGTVIFQDIDAKTYRLGLHNGSLIWKQGGGHVPIPTWTDGGCMVDKDVGLVYAVSSKGNVLSHYPTVGGGVHAYRIGDGGLAWERHFQRPFFTWPAVGTLYGRNDTSVVVSLGANAYFPWKMVAYFLFWLAALPCCGLLCLCALCRRCRGGRKWLLRGALRVLAAAALFAAYNTTCYAYNLFPSLNVPISASFEAEIYALDAYTGERQWEYKLPSWPYISAAGDSEGFLERIIVEPDRPVCLPAAYSSPTIDSTGTVYIGYMSGVVLGLRDVDGDGVVSGAGEVSAYDGGGAFLHSGPAFAPGIMAITSCDTMHVWKTP